MKLCNFCGTELVRKLTIRGLPEALYRFEGRRYCNTTCARADRKNLITAYKLTPEGRAGYVGHSEWNKQRWATDTAYREAQSKFMKERWANAEYREFQSGMAKELHKNPAYAEAHRLTTKANWERPEYREKMKPFLSGDLHPLWKGGVTPINNRIRRSAAYKHWRKAVLTRDNHTCVSCGATKESGVILHVDHIKPFALFPELRFVVENGRTLCKPCHLKTDTYGGASMKSHEEKNKQATVRRAA